MYNIIKIENAYILFQIVGTILAVDNTTSQTKLFEHNTEEIKVLEDQKSKLLEQINNAINESVTILQNSSDSEAKLGVKYMTQLRDYFQRVTDSGPDDKGRTEDTRRSQNVKLNMQDIASMFKKEKLETKDKIKELRKLAIQQKIEEWLLEREQEHKKIKDFKERKKVQRLKFEVCPRRGLKKKKKKKSSRRQLQAYETESQEEKEKKEKEKKEKKSKAKNRNMKKYPCCRKCCKASYMGCL